MVSLPVQTAFAKKNYLQENLLNYFETLPTPTTKHKEIANELKKNAINESIPIVSDDVFSFLSQLVLLKNPNSVLEIGTGGCFSTLALLEYFSGEKFISLDVSDGAIMYAHELKEKYGLFKKTQFVFCHALEYLENCEGTFDFIFVDARKKYYPDFLKSSLPLLNSRGVIVFDNLFFSGHVCSTAEKKPELEGKIELLREFNTLFLQEETLIACIYPIGDGLGVATKK